MNTNQNTNPGEMIRKIMGKLEEILEQMERAEPWKYNHICTAQSILREILEDEAAEEPDPPEATEDEAGDKLRAILDAMDEALEVLEGGEPWKFNRLSTAQAIIREILEDEED